MVEGKLKPLVEKNVLPVPGSADDKFALALLMMAAGIGIILLIELILPKTRKQ
jgi:hypothetical protein